MKNIIGRDTLYLIEGIYHMFKIKLYRALIVICMLLAIKEASAQKDTNVYSANVLDNVYPKESNPARLRREYINIDLEHPHYIIKEIIPLGYEGTSHFKRFSDYLKYIQSYADSITDAQKEFIARISYYRTYYKNSPMSFNECVYFNPSFHGVDHIIQSVCQHDFPLPEAFRFYSTPDEGAMNRGYDFALKLNKPLSEFMEPFYFKKTAITNKEYREFVEYVKDSIIRFTLYMAGPKHGNMVYPGDADPPILNWNVKINYDDTAFQRETADLYKPEEERFYRRKEVDTRKLMYYYYPYRDNRNTKIEINCYPDTLAWINDFPFPFYFSEIMANMYFWHPAFDDYPVVGISKNQAIAYLHWRTEREQEKLNKVGKGEWIVTYELPTEYEWEMVETASNKNGEPFIYPDYADVMSDYSYVTDLSVKANIDSIPVSIHGRKGEVNVEGGDTDRITWMRHTLLPSAINLSDMSFTWHLRKILYGAKDFIRNAPYVLLKADYIKNEENVRENPFVSANYDCNGISFMGSNVSEWMLETYKDNWSAVYEYQHKLLEELKGKDGMLKLAIEDYYNAKNDTDWNISKDYASLVRGGNWYDDRSGSKAGKNTDGMNVKVFVNPTFSYSTLGFRYVIKVHRRDEKKIISSLKSNLKSIE
ncbi:MAG TPA: SUMF1/EgtB/PvdO family nonheme iron enzyme [Bacteroidia bacterium]|nr:SUMF1/EgtB/PvdO family nonheme iron enzyme [Bacteroidia bacterium]